MLLVSSHLEGKERGHTKLRGFLTSFWNPPNRSATIVSSAPRSTSDGPMSVSPPLSLPSIESSPSTSMSSLTLSSASLLLAHVNICCSTKSELFFLIRSTRMEMDWMRDDVLSSARFVGVSGSST